jgi:hypothetical protein
VIRHVVTVVVLLALGGSAAPAASVPTAAVPGPPDVVDVECSPAGNLVSDTVVAGRTDGVHVRLRDTSGASDVYVVHGYRWGGGGEPVTPGTDVRVLDIPPGPAEFSCISEMSTRQDPPVTIEVVDPGGAWRAELTEIGCRHPRSSLIDWALPDPADTVDGALAQLSEMLDRDLTWRPAPEGYVDAAVQTYVGEAGQQPYLSAAVYRRADGVYQAVPGEYC